ncbi:MAG: imidazole glycerol phosphate synthase subunit HisH [Candidatus Gastranaerophilales bacterium]|nr:imidazole glycerol phosphate synthase subunit HisH [Candidatus Gastranaerophilales bacterium]
MIRVINYGGGNVRSVTNLLQSLGYDFGVSSKEREILAAEKIIFPGQGHFGQSMSALKECGLDFTIHKAVEKQIPFMGICVGLQVLFETSAEAPGEKGLGLFKGSVVKFTEGKIPQIGWNKIKTLPPNTVLSDDFYYFVNSFYVKPRDETIVSSVANYHIDFCASIEKENLVAMQFHPEKSGEAGVSTIKNWLEK